MKGYKIPFSRHQSRKNSSEYTPKWKAEIPSGKKDQRNVGEESNRGSLATQDQHAQNQPQGNPFLVKKRDWGYRSILNLKTLNQFMLYMHLIMGSLQILRYMLKEGDHKFQIDLKDASFTVPLDKTGYHFSRFLCEGNPYKFLCL